MNKHGVLVATMDSIPGTVLRTVRGLVVVRADFHMSSSANISQGVANNVESDLAARAKEMNANAVLGLKTTVMGSTDAFNKSSLGQLIFTGTAVVLEKIGSHVPENNGQG